MMRLHKQDSVNDLNGVGKVTAKTAGGIIICVSVYTSICLKATKSNKKQQNFHGAMAREGHSQVLVHMVRMMDGRFSPSSWVLFFSVLLLGLFITRLIYVKTSEGDGHLIWNSNLGKKILGDGNLSPCCCLRRCHLVLVPAKLKRRRFLSTRLRYYHNSDASFQLERLLLCGDIESNPGPANDEVNRLYLSSNSSNSTCGNLAFPFNAKGLRCCHLNVRSLPPHFDEITTLIRLNKLDIFALSETWLNSTWKDHELNIDDYYLFRQDREMSASASTHYGGGVVVYTKSNLLYRRLLGTHLFTS